MESIFLICLFTGQLSNTDNNFKSKVNIFQMAVVILARTRCWPFTFWLQLLWPQMDYAKRNKLVVMMHVNPLFLEDWMFIWCEFKKYVFIISFEKIINLSRFLTHMMMLDGWKLLIRYIYIERGSKHYQPCLLHIYYT